jgi:hypothetical protein
MYDRGVTIHRIINIENMDKSIIKEHLKKFSDQISSGKYRVTSTTHSEIELVVCLKLLNLIRNIVLSPFSSYY